MGHEHVTVSLIFGPNMNFPFGSSGIGSSFTSPSLLSYLSPRIISLVDGMISSGLFFFPGHVVLAPVWPKVSIHMYIAKMALQTCSYTMGIILVAEQSFSLVATTASGVARPRARRELEISTATRIGQCIHVRVARYPSGKKLSKIIHSLTQNLDC